MNNLQKYIETMKELQNQDLELVYDNNIMTPYVRKPRVVDEFIKDFYKSDFVDYDYNENIKMINDPKNIHQDLSREELCTILTAMIRQDRFIEGLLMDMINKGKVYEILKLISEKSV